MVGVHHDRVHGPDQVVGLVGVRVNLALEVADDRGGDDRDLAEVDDAAGAVDRDHVALADRDPAGGGEQPGLGVHGEFLGAADAGLAHAAGDHGRVAGLAAAAGQDALGGDHAVQVVRVGLAPDQDHLLAVGRELDGAGRSRRRPCRPPRPGDALIPVAILVTLPLVSNRGNIRRTSSSPETRASASSMSMRPSSTNCMAMRNAARRCACPPAPAASTACRARR